MAIEQALRDLMTDTVTIEPWASENVNVEDSFGAPVTYTCYIAGERKLVRGKDGQQLISTVQMYLDQLASFDVRSRITLPARFAPVVNSILSLELLQDDQAVPTVAHTVVYC